ASGETPWCGSACRRRSRFTPHKAFLMLEAVHNADHYLFLRAPRSDKSFTCRPFRFMIGPTGDATRSGGTMRVRAFIAAAIIAALTGPALAQQAPMQRYGEKDKEKTYNEKQLDKEAERAYQRSLRSVPEKGPVD